MALSSRSMIPLRHCLTLLLACAAFTIGFVGYWGLGRALAPAYAAAPAYSDQGPITTSTPDPALADGKHI